MWRRIAQMQWAKDSKFNYKPIAQRCFLKWGKEEMEVIRLFAREKVDNLYTRIREKEKEIERRLYTGSDDSTSDCLWHIVGLGKSEYERNYANPFLIEKRAKLHGYVENFGYCFHEPDSNVSKPAQKSSVKIMSINAKCSDMFTATLTDDKKTIGDFDGYVPAWFPNPNEEHYGDYVTLEIDVETGKIVNWKTPTAKDLSIFKPR